MPNWLAKFIGTGFVAVLVYVFVSNTLWLIFGSKLLQSLPGVNIIGITGTLRIVIMIIMTIIGFVLWLIKIPFLLSGFIKNNSLQHTIGGCIRFAGKRFKKL